MTEEISEEDLNQAIIRVYSNTAASHKLNKQYFSCRTNLL